MGYSKDENEAEIITGDAKGILRRECFSEKNIEEYLREKGDDIELEAQSTTSTLMRS